MTKHVTPVTRFAEWIDRNRWPVMIASLLIIPPATARPLVRSPEAMALGAALVGAVSVGAGLGGAYWLDTPAGPSIVCAAAVLFGATALIPSRRSNG